MYPRIQFLCSRSRFVVDGTGEDRRARTWRFTSRLTCGGNPITCADTVTIAQKPEAAAYRTYRPANHENVMDHMGRCRLGEAIDAPPDPGRGDDLITGDARNGCAFSILATVRRAARLAPSVGARRCSFGALSPRSPPALVRSDGFHFVPWRWDHGVNHDDCTHGAIPAPWQRLASMSSFHMPRGLPRPDRRDLEQFEAHDA